MAESVGGDVLGQVLQAIQILSEQMKGLGDRMEARLDMQHAWLLRMGLETTDTRDEVKKLRLEVKQAREEVQQVRKDLGAEIQAVRTEVHSEIRSVRTELQLGIRQMNDRIDRNNDALNLMVSGLHRSTSERS